MAQKDRHSDIVINLDDKSISIFSQSLKNALALSHADRRWIDFITQSVNETWDPSDPTTPTTHGYQGSEEFIRVQFEEYLLALLSCSKYHDHLAVTVLPSSSANPAHPTHPTSATPAEQDMPLDPSVDYSTEFLEVWYTTENYRIFKASTSKELFDIVEPKHPCAGGLTIDDVQRRVVQQVADLHLEERSAAARQAINERLEAGQKRMSSALVGIRNEYENRRKQFEERRAGRATNSDSAATTSPAANTSTSASAGSQDTKEASPAAQRAQELQAAASQNLQVAGQKASAYFSSWGSWAQEKKKNYYEQKSSPQAKPRPSIGSTAASSGGGKENEKAGGATGAKVKTVWRIGVDDEDDLTKKDERSSSFRQERRYDPVD